MATEAQQALVLLVAAFVLLAINVKAGATWIKLISLWPMLAALALAGYVLIGWVF